MKLLGQNRIASGSPDWSNAYRVRFAASGGPAEVANDAGPNPHWVSFGSGGGGLPPDLGERVTVLERRADRMDRKLDAIANQLASVLVKLEHVATQEETAVIKARLDEIPTRREFSSLQESLAAVREKVSSLPTWFQIMGLIGGVLVLSTALSNADRIIRAWREPATPAVKTAPPASPATG